jgi:hypothetical protein
VAALVLIDPSQELLEIADSILGTSPNIPQQGSEKLSGGRVGPVKVSRGQLADLGER